MSVCATVKEPKGTTIRVRDDSDRLYFLYAGSGRGVMINPAVFLSATGLFDQNLVIAHDRWDAYYQCGVSRDLGSFEAFVRWQQEFRASLTHVARVFCVGACMGGYAAIMFGHMLRVDEVWAFGPPTVLPDAVHVRRARAHVELNGRSPHSMSGMPMERADLSMALKRSNGVTRYNLYYHEDYRVHADAARRLAACDNVRLWPQPGDAYNVVQTLLDRALLPAVMAPGRSS